MQVIYGLERFREMMDDAGTFRLGEIAPDFVLPDSTGTMRRLSDLAAGDKLILIFYRGYW